MHRTFRVAMVGACPYPTAQGSQVLIRQLSEALAARGHGVHIVTYHLGEPVPQSSPGVRLHRIPRVPGYHKLGSGPAWGKLVLDPLLLLLLADVVRREAIDVVHAHNYEALLVSWLVSRVIDRPVAYHSHNVMTAELPSYFSGVWSQRLAARLARWLDDQLPRRADACIALSSEAIPYFLARGVAEERLRLIPPGIDFDDAPVPEAACVRERYQLGDGPLVIYTGNLDQYQRVESLLRCFRHVRAARPEAMLLIASHSPAAQYRRLLGRAGGTAGVRFVQCHSFVETRALLLAAEVAICPRMACFGFPMKLLNYMAAGKAVVVAQGAAKGIRHLENGYVVPEAEDALAEGVIHLLDHPELRRRLGAAARATVEGRFQWAHAVREIERCYADLTCRITEPVLIDRRAGSNG